MYWMDVLENKISK